MNLRSLILSIIIICLSSQVVYSQKLLSEIAYRTRSVSYFDRAAKGPSEDEMYLYLIGSKVLLAEIERDYQKQWETVEMFQEWIDRLFHLDTLLNEHVQSIIGGRMFVDVAYPLVDPYVPYYFAARTVECEGAAGVITLDYERIFELATKYGNQEHIDYFGIKVDEPGRYGYDCEGQSTNYKKPDAVRKKCQGFLESYPDSKYYAEIDSFRTIAEKDYHLFLERHKRR